MPIELEQLQIKPINSLAATVSHLAPLAPRIASLPLSLWQLWVPLALLRMKIKLSPTMANKFRSNAIQIATDTVTRSERASGWHRGQVVQHPQRITFVLVRGLQINCQWVCTSSSRKVFQSFPCSVDCSVTRSPCPCPYLSIVLASAGFAPCDIRTGTTCILSLLRTQHNSRFLRWNKFPVT